MENLMLRCGSMPCAVRGKMIVTRLVLNKLSALFSRFGHYSFPMMRCCKHLRRCKMCLDRQNKNRQKACVFCRFYLFLCFFAMFGKERCLSLYQKGSCFMYFYYQYVQSSSRTIYTIKKCVVCNFLSPGNPNMKIPRTCVEECYM